MRSTVPGRSALTVTPCTAAIVPIAFNVAGHSSCCATTVVTASGGGWKAAPCAMAVWICWNLTKPSPATITSVTVSITIIRFNIWYSDPSFVSLLLPDVQQHTGINPVAVSLFLAEERRRVVLRVHRDEAVVATQAPAARMPGDAAAEVAGQERLGVVDRQRPPLEHRQTAHTTGEVRHDRRSIRRRDNEVGAVVQQVGRLLIELEG